MLKRSNEFHSMLNSFYMSSPAQCYGYLLSLIWPSQWFCFHFVDPHWVHVCPGCIKCPSVTDVHSSKFIADGTPVRPNVFTLCQGQSHGIYCNYPSFLHIEYAVYCYNENVRMDHSTDMCFPFVGDPVCVESTLDFVSLRTERTIPNIRVPHGNVTVPSGLQRDYNFVAIYYTCLTSKF